MGNALNAVSDLGVKVIIISLILSILPVSPFVGLNNLVQSIPYLSFVNWFLPIPEMLAIMESWLVVVSVYYGILYLINYTGIVKS